MRFILCSFSLFFVGPCFFSSLALDLVMQAIALLGPATPPSAIGEPNLANSLSLHFYLNSFSFTHPDIGSGSH